MTRILLLSTYPENEPSIRFRYLQYEKMFRENDYRLKHKPFIGKYLYSIKNNKGLIYLLLKIDLLTYYFLKRIITVLVCSLFAKVVIIQKEIIPFGPPFFEKYLKFIGKKIIYDFDDAIFSYPESDLSTWRSFWLDKAKISKIIKLADRVIVGNKFLADF